MDGEGCAVDDFLSDGWDDDEESGILISSGGGEALSWGSKNREKKGEGECLQQWQANCKR